MFALLTVSALVVLQLAFAKPVLHWMLQQSIYDSTTDWAEYLLDEIAHSALPSFQDSVTAQERLIERARVAGEIGSALKSGTVAQIDIVDHTCGCSVSLGQDLAELGAEPVGRDAGDSIDSALSIILSGRLEAGADLAFGKTVLPLDPSGAEFALEHGAIHSSLFEMEDTEAIYGAAIFHHHHNDERLALRMVLDLSETAASQKLILKLVAVLFTAASGITVGLAARAIYASRRAEADSDEQARFLSQRDPTTGLFNRDTIQKRAEGMFAAMLTKGERALLILYDIDRLQEINDLHGTQAGDAVIQRIADMIRGTFPDETLMARLDGDEFAVIIPEEALDENGIDSLPVSAEIILDPSGRTLPVSSSVGFAYFPDDGTNFAEVSKSAGLALHHVKSSSRRKVGAFHQKLSDAFEARAWQIGGIRQAVLNGELQPYYQPLVNTQTHELEGVEALVRWNHPELGILSPESFDHALSDPEAAVGITHVMLKAVVKDLKHWHGMGYDFSAGLNVGEHDLRNPEFLRLIDDQMENSGLPRRSLVIEVTEKAVNTETLSEFLPILESIRSRGMFVSLDDFGTGTSSITLLRRLPCTAIKIDKSFVTNMTTDHDDQSIVRALTNLGHDLKIRVVAEGVEYEHQSDMLAEMGADLLQGYLFGRPMSVDQIDKMLEYTPVAAIRPRREPGKMDDDIIPMTRVASLRRSRRLTSRIE